MCTAFMREQCLHHSTWLGLYEAGTECLCVMQARASTAEAKVQLATEAETAAAERKRQLERHLAEVQGSLEFAEVGH